MAHYKRCDSLRALNVIFFIVLNIGLGYELDGTVGKENPTT